MSENHFLDSVLRQWNGSEDFGAAWDGTEAADDYQPLPAGPYICEAEGGELTENRNGTPCYRLTFTVRGGEHAGRRLAHSVYLTGKALPLAKRDLAKLGISSSHDLQSPIPRPVLCEVRVALRTDDDGTQWNLVRSFVKVEAPETQPASRGTQPATDPTRTTTVGEVFDDDFSPEGEE